MRSLRYGLIGTLLASLVGAPIVQAEDSVIEQRAEWNAARSEVLAEYEAALTAAEDEFTEELLPIIEESIEDLTDLANNAARRGRNALALAAWREVLGIDPTNQEAIRFLEATGTLERTLAEIEAAKAAPVEDDFLTTEDDTGPLIIGGADAPAEVVRILVSADRDGDRAEADYHEAVAEAREDAEDELIRARDRALRSLIRDGDRAGRRGEIANAAAIYRLALELDPECEPAREFFGDLGTLDVVLAEVPTGALDLPSPGDPVSSAISGAALAGSSVLIMTEDAGAYAWLAEALEAVGAEVAVESATNGRQQGKPVNGVIRELENHEPDLLIVAGYRGNNSAKGLGGSIRQSPIPTVVISNHHQTIAMAQNANYLRYRGFGSHQINDISWTASEHPILAAAGISADEPLLSTTRPFTIGGGQITDQNDGLTLLATGAGYNFPMMIAVDAGYQPLAPRLSRRERLRGNAGGGDAAPADPGDPIEARQVLLGMPSHVIDEHQDRRANLVRAACSWALGNN